MTGLDRLRELADDMSVQSLCCALLDGKQEHWNAQCWAGMTVNGMLRAIANQIEAEQEERVTRRVEDREAAEWVRESGGLDAVKERWGDSVPLDVYRRKRDKLLGHIDECETALRKRKQRIEDLGRLIQSRNDEWAMTHNEFEHMRLDHIEGLAFEKLVDDIAARLGVSVTGFDSQDTRDRIMPVLERRLMPEGYEWPRYESGEPVAFRDKGLDVHGHARSVEGVKFTQGGFVFISDDMGNTWWANDHGPTENPEIDPDKRVKRPAPKVLDADGAEIRVGDTVYEVEGTGHAYKVVGVRVGDGDPLTPTVVTCDEGGGTSEHFLPLQLTHRAPVLAADGRTPREEELLRRRCLEYGTWADVARGIEGRGAQACRSHGKRLGLTLDRRGGRGRRRSTSTCERTGSRAPRPTRYAPASGAGRELCKHANPVACFAAIHKGLAAAFMLGYDVGRAQALAERGE